MRRILGVSTLLLCSSPAWTWSVGEVVYLKSCSPTMTVTEILPGGQTGVRWFAGQSLQAASFPDASLVAYFPCPALAHAEAVINKTDNPPLPPDAP